MIKHYLTLQEKPTNGKPPLTKEEKDIFIQYKSSIDNTIVITYNPWRNLDDKTIIKDFLDELASAFKDYHADLSGLIKQYSKYLSKLNESKFTKIVETSIESIKSSNSATSLYKDINDRITQIKKRTVIFVDDLDRLNGDELIDVLKLIRNTANFRNTIFITAYDHNYILNTVDKRNLISNKEEYLQKIIQLEVTLPTFDNNLVLEFFRSELQKIPSINIDYENINAAIIKLSNIVISPTLDPPMDKPATVPLMVGEELINFIFNKKEEQQLLVHALLGNVRDAVRLINSFKMTYEAIGQIGDPFEILLLEILKTKYLSIYQLLSNRQLTKFGQNKRYVIDSSAFTHFTTPASCKAMNIRQADIPVIEKCLATIFTEDDARFFRSVTVPEYFSLYFSYDSPNTIELSKIETELAGNPSNLSDFLSKATELERKDIQSYVYAQTDFADIAQYESTISALFHLVKYDERTALSQLRSLLVVGNLKCRVFRNEEYNGFGNNQYIDFGNKEYRGSKFSGLLQSDQKLFSDFPTDSSSHSG